MVNIISEEMTPTPFQDIYDCFLSKITDDMFLELTQEDTNKMLKALFLNALPAFEFPRVDIYDYDLDLEMYNIKLSNEEINIIAIYMVVEWLNYQLANVELTRMQYSGSDFKFTSQANHMQKLSLLKDKFIKDGFHLQRLYKRRVKDKNGIMRSTMRGIMTVRGEEYYDSFKTLY